MAATDTPLAHRVLVMSRRRSVGNLVGALGFGSVGVYWITVGFLPGWIVAALSGYAALLSVVELVRPSTLHLDPGGFVVTRSFGRRTHRHRWSECSRFTAWGPAATRRQTGVIYRTDSDDRLLRRAASSLLAGGDEMIGAGFERLPARQLAQLMNEYRESAVGRRDEHLPPDLLEPTRRQPPNPAGWRSTVLDNVLLVLAAVLLAGSYLAYRLDGPPILWLPLAIVGAICLIGYAWRN